MVTKTGPAIPPKESRTARVRRPGPFMKLLRTYRYWPVLLAVSMARPDSWFLPVTRVRM